METRRGTIRSFSALWTIFYTWPIRLCNCFKNDCLQTKIPLLHLDCLLFPRRRNRSQESHVSVVVFDGVLFVLFFVCFCF